MNNVVNFLKKHTRVIDTPEVQAVQFYDDFGTKITVKKSEMTEEEWKSFKENFKEF